jgi:triacylglycerol esterase/lipase EstA (alpha/beta hydrolase family)
LAKKIQDIMAQTGSDKVDVVAHSMGGLIVKKYVMDNPTTNH